MSYPETTEARRAGMDNFRAQALKGYKAALASGVDGYGKKLTPAYREFAAAMVATIEAKQASKIVG